MSNVSVAKGSCLCGVVSVSTTNMSNHVGACHCNMCRQWGGGPLLAIECGSDVTFSGEENIGVYQSSEWAERGFCKRCGTHLFYKLRQNNQFFMPVGLFNNGEGLIFDHQFFIDEKPEYYCFANATNNLTGAEVFAQFAPPSE
ncbi:GFA family protein [Anabaena cylindrica FACHB-243]|uniref:Glutathione-dependent formaldehyde-activating GFA n=1 Tax=Anabaena cylindrica (strain ATCC 27899 / PCC 7122) TaxID=272123 RepID=K9Z922_ANACC|nr:MULTISPECIES: GFA family protein [Anabaena]AFZ55671.1 glutathione-dependent formaldehyde-activating GFA [Anabaena cylindrica PCC 7122]MBD2420321.1 GFA family protein [Anabaena cylindrica FACHB-243]MBY5282064.1 GFA family protein [Anabaena sp. CCAP 1446/1C]MBY5309638.1 GFA family protein [Anabaena sp. CCAP 1446/1C]MCM2406020.1 GFA family protein [Anabaena sp. CCAP 1446/1C]